MRNLHFVVYVGLTLWACVPRKARTSQPPAEAPANPPVHAAPPGDSYLLEAGGVRTIPLYIVDDDASLALAVKVYKVDVDALEGSPVVKSVELSPVKQEGVGADAGLGHKSPASPASMPELPPKIRDPGLRINPVAEAPEGALDPASVRVMSPVEVSIKKIESDVEMATGSRDLGVEAVANLQDALAHQDPISYVMLPRHKAGVMQQEGYVFEEYEYSDAYLVYERRRITPLQPRAEIEKAIILPQVDAYVVSAQGGAMMLPMGQGPFRKAATAVTAESNWKFVIIVDPSGKTVMRAADKLVIAKDGKKGLHHPSLAGFNGKTFNAVASAGVLTRNSDGVVEVRVDSGNYGLDDIGTAERYYHNRMIAAYLKAQHINYKLEKGVITLEEAPN